MSRRAVVRCAALAALLGLSARAEAGRYSFDELTRRVAADSPAVQAASAGVEAAENGLRAAQFLWLPAGDATLFFTGAPNVQCIGKPLDPNDPTGSSVPLADRAVRESNCLRTNVVDLRTGAPGSSLADIAPIHGVALRLDVNLNQELFSFGKVEGAIEVARAQLATAQATLERERAEMVWQASRAYWGTKAARASIATLSEAIDKLEEWTRKIDGQLSGDNPQRYTESDLIRLKLTLANTRLIRLDQERNLEVALEGLRFLTGDPEADVDEGDLELAVPDDPGTLADWLARADRRRPELRLLRAGEAVARGVRLQRLGELLPDLSMSSYLGIGYAPSVDTPQNYFFNRSNFTNATFGLVLRQPLDLGVRAARFLQAKHDLRATVERNRQARANYSTEIAKAFADYEEARGRAKETARGQKLSRGWYIAIDTNLESGLYTDGRELVEAAQNYFSFRLRNFQAIYDANLALAWLRRTTDGGDDAPPR